MSTLPSNVQPGDIISSELVNSVLGLLSLHEQRLTALEAGGSTGGGQVVITSADPATQVAAGQVLSIVGANFAFPPSDNAVTVDGVAITSFRSDSTGSVLKFIVPTSLTIPPSGKNVVIKVANSKGAASFLYRVLPPIPAVGNPPAINSVTTLAGSQLLQIGQKIRITGTNFAPSPNENIITFSVNTALGKAVYPKAGTTLLIDTANSSTTQIIVTVPDITEITPAMDTTPVTIDVGVGAQVPAQFNALVFR